MRSRLEFAFVSVLMILWISVAPTNASNFGSNVASGGDPPPPCDATPQSQCVADNGSHYVYDFNLGSAWRAAIAYAINSVYNPHPDVVVVWTTTITGADVYAYQANYGINGLWGWTECASSATYGGTDPDRWCRPQWLDLNNSYTHTSSQKEAIACHEMGHTLGLQHSNESSGSCMIKNQRSIRVISSHDSSMLSGQY